MPNTSPLAAMTQRILRRVASIKGQLTSSTKRPINTDLRASGFDGRGRFNKMGEALAQIGSILDKHNLQWSSIMDAHLFMGSKGTRHLDIAFSNPEDSFSPVYITNSQVIVTWHFFEETKKYEVLSYLS